MTYSSYTGSHDAFDDYTGAEPLPQRAAATGKPILAIMGAEEQIASDPRAALAAYGDAGAKTKLIEGAGHSPNVEKPAEIAALVLAFGEVKSPAKRVEAGHATQDQLQKSEAVRGQP